MTGIKKSNNLTEYLKLATSSLDEVYLGALGRELNSLGRGRPVVGGGRLVVTRGKLVVGEGRP